MANLILKALILTVAFVHIWRSSSLSSSNVGLSFGFAFQQRSITLYLAKVTIIKIINNYSPKWRKCKGFFNDFRSFPKISDSFLKISEDYLKVVNVSERISNISKNCPGFAKISEDGQKGTQDVLTEHSTTIPFSVGKPSKTLQFI